MEKNVVNSIHGGGGGGAINNSDFRVKNSDEANSKINSSLQHQKFNMGQQRDDTGNQNFSGAERKYPQVPKSGL